MRRKNDGRASLYNADELMLGINLYEKTESIIEVLYHLMKYGRLKSFSVILTHSPMDNFGDFLEKEKRDTDILIEVDAGKNVYALLCQETQVDGGYYFVRRLTQASQKFEKNKIIATVTALESIRYDIKDVIFIILDSYLKLLEGDGKHDIVYRTLK
jgi:hypothetical protein